ncbi:ribonuclease-3 family protein [Geosporobacter subterraneus DSM 17957]|uniref:Mini-ribonuclease 3 n=1 Tax=Geosporobacter subterraneus DSM 17957 TaxID=1121919 RepID=A0A1M6IRZ5_9FIRM|nr:ribonuclease III domain-containing protein [Geosporobacter subterraneus]SHJ37253.1 ribonuclease-3 family protein [Geosporobacter subterraneus DSM 17957]
MNIDFLRKMGLSAKTKEEIQFTHALVLAYVGDAVYEVFVRTYMIHRYGGNVNSLHRLATKFVKAAAQAEIVHLLEDYLTEEEWGIVKRGRNQKSGTVPKNANVGEYRYATGFETLIGYLYLTEQYDRLDQVIKYALEIIEKKEIIHE